MTFFISMRATVPRCHGRVDRIALYTAVWRTKGEAQCSSVLGTFQVFGGGRLGTSLPFASVRAFLV